MPSHKHLCNSFRFEPRYTTYNGRYGVRAYQERVLAPRTVAAPARRPAHRVACRYVPCGGSLARALMNSDDAVGVNNQSEDQSNNQSNDQSESAKDGAASEDAIVRTATKLLVGVFAAADVDDSHGSLHAQQVLRNLDAALQTADHFLTPERRLACRLAALLHDADDAKYFKRAPATDGDGSDAAFPNAAAVAGAAGASASIVADALRMISWVSCSKNANRVPAEAEAEPELLWPRWADRLEAVGEVGVARCYLYALHTVRAAAATHTARHYRGP